MKLDLKEQRQLRALAQSTKGTFLMEYLQKVKDEVADIRSNLKVKPEIEREVRLAVCDVIDELLIQRLSTLANEDKIIEDSYE